MARSLLGRTIDAIGPKEVKAFWGYALGYIYALARDPADPGHPDNTGTERDPWNRMVDLWKALAQKERHGPLLLEWELEVRRTFEGLRWEKEGDPETDSMLIRRAGVCGKENGEAVARTIQSALQDHDWAAAHVQVIEAMSELRELEGAIARKIGARA